MLIKNIPLRSGSPPYCAAVLTEKGFMDNDLSLEFLESEDGKKAIVSLHVEGIIEYVREYEARPVK